MKKVLIIGGGSGIGYEIAKKLNSNNYDVTCVGRKERNNFEFNYNEEEINSMIDTNLKGCIRCNQLFIDSCLKNNISGKIINISSISNKGSKYFPIYAATKAGILTYTKSIASRYDKIQSNVISPGVIKTDMSYHETPNFDEYIPSIIENTPAKRLGNITDIANTVEFLLSDKASFITGQEIVVDGGYTLPKE